MNYIKILIAANLSQVQSALPDTAGPTAHYICKAVNVVRQTKAVLIKPAHRKSRFLLMTPLNSVQYLKRMG